MATQTTYILTANHQAAATAPNTKLKNNLQDLSAATFYGRPTIHYVKIERLL